PELSYPAGIVEREIERAFAASARRGRMPVAVPPATADEAMDMVRTGLSFLPRSGTAELPTVTQARLLRELERAGSQYTAARARILSVFDGQWGFRDDGHGGPHPWLTWQTRVTGKAVSGAGGWVE